MPSRADVGRRIFNAASWGQQEVDELYTEILAAKIASYEGTLAALADEHDLPAPKLSIPIRRALADDAQANAESIVLTYNFRLREQVTKALELHRVRDLDGIVAYLEEWSLQASEHHARLIAITEAYGPHADAVLQFDQAAVEEPTYDFGGHDDPAPECELCRAIKARNPHPRQRVLEIGVPHPGCRQQWRRVGEITFPAGYVPGQGNPAGIIGQQRTLIQRRGGRAKAARAVEAMS